MKLYVLACTDYDTPSYATIANSRHEAEQQFIELLGNLYPGGKPYKIEDLYENHTMKINLPNTPIEIQITNS